MALAEVSSNNIRNNSQFLGPRAIQKYGRPRSSLQNGDDSSHYPPKLSPIQGMLKTTTELGDEGQFSVKPLRVPPSTLQLSPAPSIKSRKTPRRRRHLPPYNKVHGGFDVPYNAESPRQGSIASINSGFPIRDSSRSHQGSLIEEYRSASATQKSEHNNDLTRRQYFANGQYHSRGDASSFRPRSPYAYPTRLKRPSHRPSSPAVSDLHRTMTSYTQGLSREPSIRTMSPWSSYNVTRTPSPFHYVINQSDLDLQNYPPLLHTDQKRPRTPSMSYVRPSTPNASPTHAIMSYSSRVYRKRSIPRAHRLRPQSPPVSPVFYDYTEDFEDNMSFHSSSIPSRGVIEQPTSPVHSSSYFVSDVSPLSNNISRQPTTTNYQNRLSQTEESEAKQSIRKIPSCRDNFTSTAPQDLSDVPELPETEAAATTPLVSHQRRWAESKLSLNASESIEGRSPEADQSLHAVRKESSGHLPQEVAAKASNLKSSPIRSISSAKSSDIPEPLRSTPGPIGNPRDQGVSPRTHQTPRLNAAKRISIDGGRSGNASESLRGPSFEGRSRVSTEILSPTPERSIASPNNRDRFSKILSIDEAPLEEETLVPPPKREDPSGMPGHGFHRIVSWNTSSAFGPLRRKRSLYTRDSPLKQNLSKDILMEKSDSEEEPELTAGLRKTFCKDEDTVLPFRSKSWASASSSRLSKHGRDSGTVDQPHLEQDQPTAHHDSAQDRARETSKDNERPVDLPTPVPTTAEAEQINDIAIMPGDFTKKQQSFRSYSPPVNAHQSDLPLDFTPLVRLPSEDVITENIGTKSPSEPLQIAPTLKDDAAHIKESVPEGQSDRTSICSHPGSLSSRPTSRPWNHDSSYPWDAELPTLEVNLPQGVRDSEKVIGKPPRFKLKIQRASSSAEVPNKLRKDSSPPESSKSPFASSLDLGQGSAFRQKKNPNLFILPGQINSSHDINWSSKQRTRFVNAFEPPSPHSPQSPNVSMLLPSPNEVRSFFSDDSSQARPKGTLRKRFSDFKARAAAARAASLDDTRGYDRGLLGSALGRSRASGRSSRQSQRTGGASTRTSVARRVRWKMMEKIRLWLHRGEDKFRDWGWKMRYRKEKHRAASVPPYANA